MRRTLMLAASAVVLAFGAMAAQAQSDPVTDHFRSYEAALARGDRAGAEAAAAAALATSEARDGEGGSTATLAANLAQLRLNQNRAADALAPAQRALGIAERNANAGVNPIYARLLVGQAELASNGDAGQRRILAALSEARSSGALNLEAYEAAVTLGEWAVRNDRARVGLDAFERALGFSLGQTDLDNTLRARAYLGQGLAMTMIEQEPERRRRTGTRLTVAPESGPGEAFVQALTLSRPIAEREARTGRMTRSQVTFGAALAWSLARGARVSAMDWIDRGDTSDRRGLVVTTGGVECQTMVTPDPVPAYSVEAMRAATANAVVVRITTDASGAITDRRIVGAAGDQDFVNAVNAVLPQWRFAEPANCGARVVFTPVLVMVDDEQVSEGLHGGRSRGWVTRQYQGLLAIVPN